MKNSKFFLTTLFAAAAMGASAYGANLDLRLSGASQNISDSEGYDSAAKTAAYDNIYLTNGTLDIDQGVITSSSFRGTSENGNGATTLNVASGATLTITGTGESINGGEASFMLANWPKPGAVNVAGVLNLACGLSSRDGNGTFTVQNGGVVNFTTGLVTASRDAARMVINIQEGARVNIGSRGIAVSAGAATYNISGGTIGILGDADAEAAWSTAQALSISGNVTFDTTKYVMASDGNSSSAATEGDAARGGTITLGNINASSAGSSLNVSGVGTLALGGQVSLSTAIVNEATVRVSSNTVFIFSEDLKTDAEESVYTLISGSGTILGWDAATLSVSNFRSTVNPGLFLKRGASVSFEGVASGQMKLVAGTSADLVWNGGNSGTWDVQTTRNWRNEGEDDVFCLYDNAKFATDGEVNVMVGSGVVAEKVTIAAGTVSFSSNKVTANSGFLVQDGATLKLTNAYLGGSVTVETGGTFDMNGVEGAGYEGVTLVTLSGGKLVNTGNSQGLGNRQFHNIALTADSEIGGTGNFGLLGSGYAATTLDLGGHTLTKTGSNDFLLVNTTVRNGKLLVTEGSVSNGTYSLVFENGASVEVVGSASASLTISSLPSGSSVILTGTDSNHSSTLNLTGGTSISGNLTIGNATVNVTAQNDTFNWNVGTDQLVVLNEGGTLNFGNQRQSLNSHVKFTLNGGTITGTGDEYGAMDFYSANTIKVTADSILEASVRLRSYGGSGNLTFDVDEGKTLTFTGVINKTADNNDRKVVKSGAGTMILSGDSSNYSNGGFSLEDGTIVLRHANALGTGTLAVAGDATLEVAQTVGDTPSALTLANAIAVASGKTLSLSSQNDANALEGVISGDGALKKIGAGTLTLSGANTYSGGTTIEGGALVAANADALGAGGVSVGPDAALKLGAEAVTVHGLSGEGSVALADGTAASTLTLDAAVDGAFEGAFSGAISLTKSGAGTQTLSGASTHTGTTTVSAGTLVAKNASALGTGDVSVNAGATLEHGIARTTVTIGGALTTENGATLSFGSFVGQTAPLYSVAGDATIAAGTIIDVESYAGLAENGGMVSLIDCAGTLSTTASDLVLKFCGLDAKSAGSARYTAVSAFGGYLSLYADSASMTWNGGVSGVWSAGGEGWTGSAAGGDVTAFENGDDVTFGDAGAGTVTLSGAVGVSSLTIDSANDYNFTGTNDAEIRGVGAFTKRGAGTATVDLATIGLSRYSGEFVVEEGTLVLPFASDATFSKTISGAGTFAKTGAGALTLTGDLSALTGTLAVNEGSVVFSDAEARTVAATISGSGTLKKTGAGTLTLTGANSSVGTLALSGGKLEMAGDLTSGNVSVDSGVGVIGSGTLASSGLMKLLHGGALAIGELGETGPTVRVASQLLIQADTGYWGSASLTMNSGLLEVEASSDTMSEGDAGIRIGINNLGVGSLTLNGGEVSVKNAHTTIGASSAWGASGTLNINDGVYSTRGIVFSGVDGGYGSNNSTLNLNGGRLNVGAGGIMDVASSGVRTFNFAGGTLGAFADWSSAMSVSISGNVTIDTLDSEDGTTGRSITLSGALSSAGTLTVTGAGTLSVSNMSFNNGTETRVEGGATLDLTGNSCGNTGGSAVLAIDGEGSTVKLANGAWGNGTNFGAGFAQSLLTLSNGGVLEVTATQDESTAGRRGFFVTAGTGTYRYSGTGTSYIAHNGSNDAANQFIGLAAGATLNFDVAADAVLNVSKIIALNGDSATTATTGNLTKSGAGTLVLDPNGGTNNFSGTITLAGGALEIAGAGALGTSGNVVFAATGTSFGATAATTLSDLTLTFGDVFATDKTTGVSISNITFSNATIEFSDAAQFATAGTVLLLSGYTGTTSDFNLNYVGDGRIYVDAGNLYFSTFMGDLYWNGAVNDVWNTTDANWTEDGVTNRTFVNASSVTFRTADAAVQLAGAFSVSTMTVSESVAFSAAEGAEASSISVNYTDLTIDPGKTLTIGEGVTLDLSGGDAQAGVSRSDILGSGTVKLKLTTTYTNALSLDGFAGTTYVTAGNFRINDAKFGDTLHLAGGVNFELSGGSTVELGADKNLVLDGTTQVHQNSSANLTFNGSVTGAGTYDRRGAGTLTFNGAVALGGFLQQDNSNDGAVTTFGGTADFANGATLNFAKGSASFNGATTFGDNATLTHSSSSALSFNAPVTFGSGATITHSNGTLTFGGATTFGDGATLTISTGNLASISFTNSLSVGENLKIYYGGSPNASTTLAIGELALSGASTTLTTQNWHGAYQIGKLSLAAGTASATLNLVSEQTSALFSVYELGASGVTDSGDFAGTINVSSTNGGDTRSVSLVLSDANIAKNAVVNLAALASPGAQLALGVNAASVTIGGLESAEAVGDRAKVYSGKVAYGANGGAALGDGTTRALVIDTTAHADTEHVFRGVIGADLALTKTGAGTQVLTNAGNAFAALEVSGGTLAATNVGALGAADSSVTLTDGTLELRGVAGAGNDAAEFAKSLTGAGTFALTNTSKVSVAADKLSGFTGTLNVADEASTLQVSAAAGPEKTVGATLDGAGTFEKLGDGTLVLSAAAAAYRTGSTTVSAGTLALTNARALGSGDELGSVGVFLDGAGTTLELRDISGLDSLLFSNKVTGTGTFSLTGSSQLLTDFGAQLSNFEGDFDLGAGTRLNLGIDVDDVAAFGQFRNAASIGDGATLGIDAGAADAAFAMALSGTGTLEKLGTGTLTLAAAPADTFTGTLNIAAGTLKLDGTTAWILNNDVAGTGALEIAGKITAHASKFTSEFTGATTVLENSELEIWTETPGSLSLSTAVTGAGTLTKTGAGTLSLAAGTTVKTVDLRAGGLAGVNLGSGQTLKISYDDVTLSGTNTLTAGTLSFLDGNSALTKLTIADGTTTVGGDLKIDVNVAFPSVTNPSFETGAEVSHVNTYTLIEVASGATLDGWDTLTKDNFLVNGAAIESHRESVLTNVAPGQISLELKSFDLLWNGGNGVWNVNDEGNLAWTRTDTTGATFVETYMNSDRVTFAGTATVTLGADVAPQTIAVTGGGTLTLDCGGYAVKYGTTTIEDGSTLALKIGDANHVYFAEPVTVSGAGTLKLDMNADADLATLIAGTISGADGLTFEKAGTKTLTVSGGASGKLAGFTADNVVSVSAGTLVIEDGFASIGGAELNVGRGATAKALLTFDESLSNRISGSGTFVKQGAGTLTLSADSTAFSGSLFVDEGTVRLEDANGMGDAALGTDVTVNPAGTLVLAFSDAVYNKNFHGTGTIVADNGEKLTLRGGEGDFSGDFVVNGGLVSAQLGGSFGAGTIVFADADKAVEFKLTEAGAFAGSFSGEGTATLAAGSKELTLSGASSDGFAGTLKVETSAVAEHAEVLGSADATVEIGASGVLSVEAGTLKAKLAGSGMLAKTTAGTLTLANADNADFTGRIAVKEGALSVSDAAALGATRGVELFAGATLDIVVRAGETFTLDRAVTGEGDLLVRGDGDGTHAFVYGLSGKNFHGNMTFSGVSAVSASNFTADDGLLRLTNAATWDARGGVSIGEGSTLTLLSTRAPAAADVRTTSADSEAGIASTLTSGGFRASSGVSGSAELSGISVTPTTTASGEAGAVLSFGVDSRPDARVAPIALSGDGSVTLNNVSVEVLLGGDLGSAFDISEIRLVDTERGGMVDGSGVDSATIVLADGSEVEYHYRNGWLTLEAVPTGMNLAYAAMVTLPTETFSQDVRSLHRRMEQRRFGVEDRNEWQFFAQAQTMSADTGSDKSDSATFDYSTYGALVGADVRVGESTLFGLALAYDRGTADIHDNQGEITSDAYRATLYAGTVFADYLYAEAGAHVGFASNEIDRKGDYDRNKGDADAWSAGAFATVGGVIPTGVDGFFLTPHVGVAYLTTHVESFEERGTSAMDVDSISADSLRASVGLGAQVAFDFGEVPTRFTLDVSYSRECLDDDVDAKIRTEDGSLTRTEKAFAEDVISVGAGLDFSLSKNTGVFLNYTADFGLNSDVTHRADAGFRFTW